MNLITTLRRKTYVQWAVIATVLVVGAITPGLPVVLAQDDIQVAFDFTLENDAEGWTVDFADLPIDYDQSIFELDSGHRHLPTA